MPTIDESRESFLHGIRTFTRPVERPSFQAVLDDFINWSTEREPDLVHFDKEYVQGVVSFQLMPHAIVLWSAYPREDGGAKLEILPGSARVLNDSVYRDALETLRSISREPISESTTLRIPFTALKNEVRRNVVKDLLSRLIVSLAR